MVESIHQETGTEGFTLENVLTDTQSEADMVEKISLRQAVDALAERVHNFLSNPLQRNETAAQAASLYSKNTMYRQFQHIYQELTSCKRSNS